MNIEIFVIIISFVILLWVILYVTSNGLDLKKRSSWLYGLISFFCGFVSSLAITIYLGEGIILRHVITSLVVGAIFAFVTMFQGGVMRFHQRNATIRDGRIKNIFLRLKKKKEANFFERLAQKILEKFI